jgi:hypothetical protein
VLPAAARRYLEELMSTTYEYQSDFARKYYAEGEAVGEAKGEAKGEAVGEAKGEARALLAVLRVRGVEVPADAVDRITNCADVDQLMVWILKAPTAESIEDVLD